MDFRKSIDGLAVLVELDIKVAVFDPVLFVFLKGRGKRKPLSADLPHIEVIHELLEHERPVPAVAASISSAKKPASSWILCRCRSV
ncbi:ISPsy5, transposase [Pseudomonas amygdali pv. mori]|uniref:ISPsy5, transposase n=1 Tax=Pseudomonas amygdali pv. mori TaxID=34065 RepID=A0A0P9W0E9_PSEA0|nr:ISPsy5, transposase [Pseudomonas amygdali pv. mori]